MNWRVLTLPQAEGRRATLSSMHNKDSPIELSARITPNREGNSCSSVSDGDAQVDPSRQIYVKGSSGNSLLSNDMAESRRVGSEDETLKLWCFNPNKYNRVLQNR